MKVCNRCVCDERIPGISFNEAGVCNYCQAHDDMEKQYPISETRLNLLVEKIKKSGKGKQYDCVIGISGGCDSSYLMWKLHEKGLRMIASHWDNNWNSKTAEENMWRMLKELDIDYQTRKVPINEYDDLCKAFLLASTPDADIPNDIALATTLYEVAKKYELKYIINGHSFRTEGFTPLGWTYMDGKYIESVHRRFGRVPLHNFPNLSINKWIDWLIKDEIKRIRPLYYMDYNKNRAKQELNREFGWEWYGGHHAENRYTKFVGNCLWIQKFGIDLRFIEFSALIRSGQMERVDAMFKLGYPPIVEKDIISEVCQRLNLTLKELYKIMEKPVKHYTDYDTYKSYFEENKTMFKNMLDKGLIPYTFYKKYCE